MVKSIDTTSQSTKTAPKFTEVTVAARPSNLRVANPDFAKDPTKSGGFGWNTLNPGMSGLASNKSAEDFGLLPSNILSSLESKDASLAITANADNTYRFLITLPEGSSPPKLAYKSINVFVTACASSNIQLGPDELNQILELATFSQGGTEVTDTNAIQAIRKKMIAAFTVLQKTPEPLQELGQQDQ